MNFMEKNFNLPLGRVLMVILLLLSIEVGAQNEDCIDFQVVCSDDQISNTPTGSGSDDFSDPDNNSGCLGAEHESAWFYFEFDASTPPNSPVTFVIDPIVFTDDYDFALFGPNVTCDDLGSPIRCSYSAADGPTGLSTSSSDTSEGAGGDAFVSEILVNAGDGFYLLVDNFSSSSSGFDLTWGESGSNHLDCNPSCTLMVDLPASLDVCEEAVFTINSTITDASGSETYQWVGTGGAESYMNATDIPNPEVTLPPGFSGSITYTLTVNDGTCVESADIIITTLPPPVPNGGNFSFCNGESVTLDAGGGFNSYNWSTGESSQTIVVVTPGSYDVTVTDNNSCPGIGNFMVTQNPPINVNISGDLVICAGGSTTLTADAGYVNYNWSTGETTESITVNAPGDYTVTVADADGCTGTQTVTVTDMSLPDIPITQSPNFLCSGSNVSLDAGVGFASYSWSTGEHSQLITVLSPGIYSVTVENNSGCVQTGSIEVQAGETPNPYIDGNLDICEGMSTTLTAIDNNVVADQWSTGQATQSIDVASGGNYSVTVTNADGCEGETQVLVIASPIPEPEITGISSLCPGDNGMIGIISTYDTYAWSTGESTQQIQIFNSGNYSVTVTDLSGCEGVSTYEVLDASVPIPIIDGELSFCENGSTTLFLTENFSSYAWSDGSFQPTLFVTAAGNYSVTVTNSAGCSGEASVNVDVTPNPIPTLDGALFMCEGEENVQISVLENFDAYTWSTGASSQDIFVNAPGTYSVTVTNGGCTGTGEWTITELLPLDPQITGDPFLCSGGFTALNVDFYDQILWSDGTSGTSIEVYDAGPVSVTVADANGCTGTDEIEVFLLPPLTPQIDGELSICDGDFTILSVGDFDQILWSDGTNGNSIDVYETGTIGVTVTDVNGCFGSDEVFVTKFDPVEPEISGDLLICNGDFTVLSVGSFDQILWSDGTNGTSVDVYDGGEVGVTVTDANGCSGSAMVMVTELDEVLPYITGDLSLCNGGFTTLSVGAYDQILWSDGTGGTSIDVDQAGEVGVTVVDDYGCTGEAHVFVTESPNFSVEITGPTEFCDGSVIELATVDDYVTYQWSTGDNTPTTSVDQTGEYFVTVTNENGCEAANSIFVESRDLPVFEVVGSRTFCPGSETTLSILENFSHYEWSSGSTATSITIDVPGTYSVTVTDDLGCTSSLSISVTEEADLNPSISGGNSFCEGSELTLDVGDGYDTYLWSNGEMGHSIIVTDPGIYAVTVGDDSGCSGEAEIEVIQYPNPIPQITGTDTVCFGNTIDLGLSQTYEQYTWSTGENTASITAEAGISYQVTVIDNHGCSGSATHFINTWENPIPLIEGNANFCPESQTTLSLDQDYTNIEWSTGSTDDAIIVTTADNFTVTVADEHACMGTSSFETEFWATEVPNISGSLVYCPDESTQIQVEQPYESFHWSNGDTTSYTSIQTEGNVFVTVTDGNGCQTDTSVFVSELNVDELNFTGVTSFCEGDTITIALSDEFSSYLWSTGATSQSIQVTEGGIYDVTVAFENSCTASSSINIVENMLPNVQIGGSASYCVGSSTILNAGATYESYLWSTGETSFSIDVASEDNYSLTVTDEHGCVNTGALEVVQDDYLHPIISGDLAFCENGSTTLDAGSGFATYTWSNNLNTQIIEVAAPGTYSITVTDAGGCIGDTSVTVVQNPLPDPQITGVFEFCQGESTVLSVEDEELYQSFEWSNGTDLPTIEVHEAGTYTVLVTNEFNCETSTDKTVIQHALPIVEIEGIDFFCEGASTVLTGPLDMNEYLWSTGDQTEEITVSSAGLYQLEVVDEYNCRATNEISIQEILLPDVPVGSDQYLDCDTESVQIGEELFEVNPNWVFTWQGPSIDLNNHETNPIVGAPGTYALLVTDTLHGCLSVEQNVEVVDLSYDPEIHVIVLDSLDCVTESVRLSTYAPTPLSADVVYQWSKDQEEIDGAHQDFYLATEPGYYSVSILDTLTACAGGDGAEVIENTAFPIADAGADQYLDCHIQSVEIGGENSQEGPTIVYEWATLFGGENLSGVNESVVDVTLPGLYQLTVRDTLNGCENVDSIMVEQDIEKPIADAGADQVIDCHTDQVTLDGTASSFGSYYHYEWYLMDDNTLLSEENTLLVDTSGTYQLVVTNEENGCQKSDWVTVNLDDNYPRGLVVEEEDVTCFGDSDGVLSVQSVIGDEGGPFLYSINGGALTASPVFAQLEAGNYTLMVQNPDGCEYSEQFVVQEGNDLSLDLGGDQFILFGDSTQVVADINIDLDKITTMIWSTLDSIACLDVNCVTVETTPYQTTDYGLTIIDENGCQRTDEITIFVEKPRDVFVPSGFSPNGDGLNDILMIYSGKDVSYVRSFLIYNRWGEDVFEVYNFPTNEATYGWDGTQKGRKLNTGVFVYVAEVVFLDGETKIFKGDITLMR